MFEKYLAQVVIAQMLEQSHPIFQPEHCINRKQKRSICTTCSEICPHHIYTYGKIMKPDWSLCSNCNLCVSACPSRALMSSSLNAQRFLDMLNDNSTVIQIGCPYYTFETPFTVECLGALPWELLASIALRKKLMLLKGDCNQCENKAGCQLFQKNIYRLQVFLQDDYFNQQVQITTDQIAVEEYIFSRRELLTMAKDRLTNTVKTIMPAKNEINGLLYRSVLYHLVDKSKKDFRWIVPKISENCTFCGVCETLCPQKAIHVDKESKQIRLDLWKCSACETCKNTCMNNGINEMDILEIHSLKPIILHERSKL